MANNARNIITMEAKTPEDLDFILNEISSTYSLIDLDKIAPVPEELNIDCDSKRDCALLVLQAEQGKDIEAELVCCMLGILECGNSIDKILKSEEFKEYKEKVASNLEKYNYPTWYDFRLSEWGTSKNTDDDFLLEKTDTMVKIYFETAWCPPIPIFEKLVKKYQDKLVSFKAQFFDWNKDEYDTNGDFISREPDGVFEIEKD